MHTLSKINFSNAYYLLIKMVQNTKKKYLNVIFIRELCKEAFDKSLIHDSHEFFKFFLLSIQDELNI